MTEQLNTNDEIDLVDLIRTLWAKKIWIILSTIIAIIIGGAYAFTAKEQWTSKAEVTVPRAQDIQEYINLRERYVSIMNTSFNEKAVTNNFFTSFITNSNSINNKRLFIQNSPFYQQQIKGKSAAQQKILLNTLVTNSLTTNSLTTNSLTTNSLTTNSLTTNSLTTSLAPNKVLSGTLSEKITFKAETATQAQALLTQFMQTINKQVSEDQIYKIKSIFSNTKLNLQEMKKNLEDDAVISYEKQKHSLESALKIAKQSGIIEHNATVAIPQIANITINNTDYYPSISSTDNNPYLFMLGTKFLQAKLDILNQEKLSYPAKYYQVSNQLMRLKALIQKVNKLSNLQSYYYIESPSYPVTKDKPKKALILVIAALLGGILGCGGVLLHSLFSTKKEEEKEV